MNDIFTARFLFPEKVAIVAPGPNGHPAHKAIRCYKIAVNRAVLLPGTWPHAWIVADKTGIEKDWWLKADLGFRGTRIFALKLMQLRAISWAKYVEYFGRTDFTFMYERLGRHNTDRPKKTFFPMPYRFQPDGTTSGIAIEMAARFGAREIALCGVDFEGIQHWDGFESPCTLCDRAESWDMFLPYMNSLIQWVREQGIDIYSLSKTRLDIEVRE